MTAVYATDERGGKRRQYVAWIRCNGCKASILPGAATRAGWLLYSLTHIDIHTHVRVRFRADICSYCVREISIDKWASACLGGLQRAPKV